MTPTPQRQRRRRPPRPSFPNAFKSKYYVESRGWDAAIKVDYDNDRNPFTLRQLRTTAAWLHQQRVAIVRVEIAATRKGHHLRAWTDTPIGPYRTLRIQTMLGDDPFRQAFNLRRVRKHEEGWNVLWNKKYRNGRLIMQEAVDPTMTQQAHRILQCPTPKPRARKPNRPTQRPNSGSNSSSSRRGG